MIITELNKGFHIMKYTQLGARGGVYVQTCCA